MVKIFAYDINDEQIDTLVQWDTDVYIYIKEDEITQAYDVHFFNNYSSEACVVNSEYTNGTLRVKIPNILLTEPYPIFGYVVIEMDSGQRSIYFFQFAVRKRPEPSDHVHVDTKDYINIEDVLAECKEYAASAESSSVTSGNYADLSKSYAIGDTGVREGENTDNSKYYSEQSHDSSNEAGEYAQAASESEANAAASEKAAAQSETNAASSENNAAESESQAQYYYELAHEIAESFQGALRPMGSVTFEELSKMTDIDHGDMYNITDEFVTTNAFVEGAGFVVPEGSNVYYTMDNLWDIVGGVLSPDIVRDEIDAIFT